MVADAHRSRECVYLREAVSDAVDDAGRDRLRGERRRGSEHVDLESLDRQGHGRRMVVVATRSSSRRRTAERGHGQEAAHEAVQPEPRRGPAHGSGPDFSTPSSPDLMKKIR